MRTNENESQDVSDSNDSVKLIKIKKEFLKQEEYIFI